VRRGTLPEDWDVGKVCHPRRVSRPDYYGNPAGLTNDIDVVRAIFAAFAARDADRAIALLAPDCALHLTGTASRIGRTEPYRGHDGMREYFADVERTWEKLELFADDYRAIPGAVVVMGHVEGRFQGEPVRRSSVWTWKVRQGKATELRVADTGPLP
jgi:ketosteroid isomerase-like protein